MPKPRGDQPQRPRPGRPRRTAQEREAAKERRIEASYTGRRRFRPGDPHVLNVQEREARNYRALLALQLGRLQATTAALNALDDPGVVMSQEENELKQYLWDQYQEHKHRDHVAATWLVIRRERLLARLQAADDALRIAVDLLAPDDSLLQDLHRAVEHHRQEIERSGQQPKAEPPQIDERHLYGDVQKHRARLAEFEIQVATMRAAISPAIGWFEEYRIKKTRYTAEARAYLMRNEPIPPDVQAFEDVWYGPYLKYRWQEETDGPAYTIQMTLIPYDELSAEDEESPTAPWANL